MSVTKERPILFSGAMVRAILEGRKTVTRREIKPQPFIDNSGNFCWNGSNYGQNTNGPRSSALASPLPCSKTKRVASPYGKPGDRLWVREAWQLHEKFTDNCVVVYKANERNSWTEFHRRFPVGAASGTPEKPFQTHGFRPSIHMPRWACRILLEITAVRVERLQDISEPQAIAEGIVGVDFRPDDGFPICTGYMVGPDDGKTALETHASKAFAGLWRSINGPDSWNANPWVWVVEFKRIEQ